MKITILLSIFLSFFSLANAQHSIEQYLYSDSREQNGKPSIDFAAIDNWKGMPGAAVSISDDGQYWSYLIGTAGKRTIQNIVGTTKGEVCYNLAGISKLGQFSGNNRWYFYQTNDSLVMLPLPKGTPRHIKAISGYQYNEGRIYKSEKIKWLAWQYKDSSRTVVLLDFNSGKEVQLKGVQNYSFEGSGKWLICKLKDGDVLLHPLLPRLSPVLISGINQYQLSQTGDEIVYYKKQGTGCQIVRIHLPDQKVQILWEQKGSSYTLRSWNLDKGAEKLVFIMKDEKAKENGISVWYWEKGQEAASLRIMEGSSELGKGMTIGSASLTEDGRYIQLELQPAKATLPKAKSDAVQVDIWHYLDTVIQSEQLMYGKTDAKNSWQEPRTYKAVMPAKGGKLVHLESKYKRLLGMIAGDLAIVKRDDLMDYDVKAVSERDHADSVWFVNLKNGNWHFWKKRTDLDVRASRSRHYIWWYDARLGDYFTYDIKTGKEVNISSRTGVSMRRDVPVDPTNGAAGYIGWLERDKAVLVYDNYDIWLLDPSGTSIPVCITNGYGSRNGIKFRVTEGDSNKGVSDRVSINPNSELVLTAFDTRTMNNGFYRVSLKKPGNPEKLFMGPYAIDFPGILLPNVGDPPSSVMAPVKARDGDVWIVKRQSATESPNYFVSKDLKTYQALTNNQPQSDYNWIRKELIRFKQVDGTMSQGILYKPQNFDATKKYPLIIHYYFQFSQKLNEFPHPKYMDNANIEPAYLASRGYLVFEPDVYFTQDRPRPASAWNTVEGAALHLKQLPFVDRTKMAISGHSRGGGYTNYIITHSKLFAAAIEGAGVSNWVSAQHTLIYPTGRVRSTTGQEPYIFTNKEFMMDNPILNADKVSCPVLIFHNKLDVAVPWEQGVELYIALRRLGKPVWMLQYDGEDHALLKKNNKMDFTIRVTQFFDHYLKGAPAPVWMTKGVPARLKGVETGLELDFNKK